MATPCTLPALWISVVLPEWPGAGEQLEVGLPQDIVDDRLTNELSRDYVVPVDVPGSVQQRAPPERTWNAGILRPIPVGQRKIRVARQIAAYLLEVQNILSVPRQEVPVPVWAASNVDFSLPPPVARIALGQALHLSHRCTIGGQRRVVPAHPGHIFARSDPVRHCYLLPFDHGARNDIAIKISNSLS